MICLTDDTYSIGPRRLSSQLKRHGFEVNLIFLQAKSLWGQIKERFSSHYDESDLSEPVYRELISLCGDSKVVGLNVWTHNADRAALITRRLRQELDCPIVWGGIHPTCFPEQSMEMVEGICLGEGYLSFWHLAEALRDGP
ncbi:MAG: cobalamin B12-binding domain-containing protein [Acidobacteria bacterium]|nr:cobalamin B12-binding domain-containing protein [Acidobacteriota bacterium]MBI3658483.1 cobalamin B12-binding domain-containing protein [Acidobacteriota bacterium]